MSIAEKRVSETRPKTRILVAEDSVAQQKIISRYLEQQGYEVALASNGLEAVNKVYELNPSLLVLDIEMPQMNGYQVCRLLKADKATESLPIIMLTSRSQPSDRFWGLKTGADRYITKDSSLSKIGRVIERLLGESKERRNIRLAPSQGQAKLDVLHRVNELLDHKLYEATIINEISELAALIQDYKQTINMIMVILGKIIDYDAAATYLLEEDEIIVTGKHPVTESFVEDFRQRLLENADHPSDPSKLKTVLYDEFGISDKTADTSAQVADFVSFPLTAKGRVIAYMAFASSKKDAICEEAQKIMDIAKNSVTIVVDNARLYEETKTLAITDGLTRIYNFRYFLEILGERFETCAERGSRLSLIMLDIDYFKRVNDQFGHLVGDEILKELVTVIKDSLRTEDIVARYGGEEFVIILPNTPMSDARMVAERLRRSVANRPFSSSKGPVPITVSIGIASYPAENIDSQFDLISLADQAMYLAKEGGRDKVCEVP